MEKLLAITEWEQKVEYARMERPETMRIICRGRAPSPPSPGPPGDSLGRTTDREAGRGPKARERLPHRDARGSAFSSSRPASGAPAVYLGLGSNLGDRQANLRVAIERIAELGVSVARASAVYETEPVGMREQPAFLNQVVEIRGQLRDAEGDAAAFPEPPELLAALLEIEHDMGRERAIPGGPRVIDIDLLFYGDAVLDQPGADRWTYRGRESAGTGGKSLGADAPTRRRSNEDSVDIVVPHPRLHLRRFVLVPLCDIAPDLIHPVLGKTCARLLAELGDSSRVSPYKPQP